MLYFETHLIGFVCKIDLCEKHLRVICKFFSNITHCSLLSEYVPSDCFPFLFIGSAAKAFETLKKNYSRKSINFQKSLRSGTGTRDIETTKKELEVFSFLRWLDSFIWPRKTKKIYLNYLWK